MISGCGKKHFGRGWCQMHYERWRVHGDPEAILKRYVDATDDVRFWAKVEKTDTCWLWTAKLQENGYGRFKYDDGHLGMAHRWVYEQLVGPIPEGLVIDHLCQVKHCVNPDHLEAVSSGENVLRGDGPTAVNARKTSCLRGHEFSMRPSGGRKCLVCEKAMRSR